MSLNRVRSDDADFGANANSLVLGSETNVGLLLTVGTVDGVDSAGNDTEYFLESFFDLDFISSVVNQESKSVLFGHALVGLLSAEGLNENRVLVKLGRHLEAGL